MCMGVWLALNACKDVRSPGTTYRQLQAAMCVLGIESRSSGKVTSALQLLSHAQPQVSCCLDCPGASYAIDQAGLELTVPLASAIPVLKPKSCTTVSGKLDSFHTAFKHSLWIVL